MNEQGCAAPHLERLRRRAWFESWPLPLRRIYEAAALCSALLLMTLIGCAWSLIALPLTWVAPRAWRRRIGVGFIYRYFALYVRYLEGTGLCEFDLRALTALSAQRGIIVAPNHPSMLDALLLLSRLPRGVCVMKSTLTRNWVLGAGARLAAYIPNDRPFAAVRAACDALADGAQLLLFPEGTRTAAPPFGDVHALLPLIARQASAPVQTVLIETNSAYLCKGWPLWRLPPTPIFFRVRLGRRFEPTSDVRRRVAELAAYFHGELSACAREAERGDC